MRRVVMGLISASVVGCAYGQSIPQLQEAFENCVVIAVIERESAHEPASLAVERAFADCQIEENALFTTAASAMVIPPGFIGAMPADAAALKARSQVDRLKLELKARLTGPPPVRR